MRFSAVFEAIPSRPPGLMDVLPAHVPHLLRFPLGNVEEKRALRNSHHLWKLITKKARFRFVHHHHAIGLVFDCEK